MTLSAKSIIPIAYGYNIQDWLKSMESGSFCEELHYNEGQGKHLYGGNISSIVWRRKGEAGDNVRARLVEQYKVGISDRSW